MSITNTTSTTAIVSKEERKQQVLKLYLEDGKTYREIAHELRISLRDISAIINEFTEGKKPIPEKSNTAKAFQLFKDKKSLVDVAIELDISAQEVEKIYTDFLKLDYRHKITLYYEQIKDHLPQFIKYYEIVTKNRDEKDKILKIINNDQIITKQDKKIYDLDEETGKLYTLKYNLQKEIARKETELVNLQNQTNNYY